MPTATVITLNDKYSKYLDLNDLIGGDPADLNAFEAALNEVMPRVYMMGFWRDTMETLTEVDVSKGVYILPVGYDSILGAILDDSPAVLYSLWHDYRLFGEPSTTAASNFTTLMGGFIDDGYATTDPYDDGAEISPARRRYRVGNVDSDTKATLLLRRQWVDVDGGEDTVYIPNDATIIKHALLGKLAEANADIQRAEYHWQTAQKLLEADLDSYRGGARPKVVIAPEGVGSGMGGMY